MHRKGWYLVAYDIACPRRLAKIHRLLKRKGIAIQKSVFLVRGTEQDIDTFFDLLTTVIVRREDDLRAYPIRDPSDLWTSGPNPLARFPLLYLGGKDTALADCRRRKNGQSKLIKRGKPWRK